VPDSVSPTDLTVDAQGRVGIDLSGHLTAAGVDLDAATTGTPPADEQIRWLRQSDGELVGSLVAITGALGVKGDLLVQAFDPDDITQVARLQVLVQNSGRRLAVAQAGTQSVTLASSDGAPVVSGSRGGTAALASLLTALSILGFIDDTTTP
jgi:hypothetical protein